MDLLSGPPPGLSRPKTSPPPPHTSLSNPPPSPHPVVVSPIPRRATAAPWASSLAAGLFPATYPLFPAPPQVPHGLLPTDAAVQSAVGLYNNSGITDLGTGLPAPTSSDPWHRAHARVCAHAVTPCAACSVALFCCTCRALRFTPGPPPASPSVVARRDNGDNGFQRLNSASPDLFRQDVGNGPSPLGFDSLCVEHNDDAYARALAECDTCDNISCPRGPSEPATWTLTVEQFDDGIEEFYDRTFRACGACNRSCKRSFMGHKVKSRTFDNSTKEISAGAVDAATTSRNDPEPARKTADSIPGSASYARKHPADAAPPTQENSDSLVTVEHSVNLTMPGSMTTAPNMDAPSDVILTLQDSLRELNERPPTPAAFVAFTRVRHDAACTHQVDECSTCSGGLLCCSCKSLFKPAVARHLKCTNCRHVAHTCCTTCFCCQCSKPWTPSDSFLLIT